MTAGKGKKKVVNGDAYSLYGQAVEALYSSKFEAAKSLFERIGVDFPHEVEIQARARSFAKICARKLESGKDDGEPRSAEQAFNLGVFHHNRGDFERALQFFDAALSLSSGNEQHIHYAKAATMVRQGDEENALKHLQKAVEADSSYRYHALHDPDFLALSESVRFRSLVGERG